MEDAKQKAAGKGPIGLFAYITYENIVIMYGRRYVGDWGHAPTTFEIERMPCVASPLLGGGIEI